MSMLFECPHCAVKFHLYQSDRDFDTLWCPRCGHSMVWKPNGELLSRNPLTDRFVGDLDAATALLVAVGLELDPVTIEVRGELARFAWDLGDFCDFGTDFFDYGCFDTPGLYVWEGEVVVIDNGTERVWDYLEDLKHAGGWTLDSRKMSSLRKPLLSDAWDCLRVEGEDVRRQRISLELREQEEGHSILFLNPDDNEEPMIAVGLLTSGQVEGGDQHLYLIEAIKDNAETFADFILMAESVGEK